jgi:hypothetical protein
MLSSMIYGHSERRPFMGKTTRQHVPVTRSALIQRINRTLRKQDKLLKTTRGGEAIHDLGEFYVLDVQHNRVIDTQVDVEALGRKVGCLRPWEGLAT